MIGLLAFFRRKQADATAEARRPMSDRASHKQERPPG